MNIFNPVILVPVITDVVLLYVLYSAVREVRFGESNNGME